MFQYPYPLWCVFLALQLLQIKCMNYWDFLQLKYVIVRLVLIYTFNSIGRVVRQAGGLLFEDIQYNSALSAVFILYNLTDLQNSIDELDQTVVSISISFMSLQYNI